MSAPILLHRPTVGTVVLNYRSTEDTVRCVDSLRTSSQLDQLVVVVDNDEDGPATTELRSRVGNGVDVLCTGDNLGYAAGNNIGIRHVLARRPDFVWILNPDAEVEPETLERLLAAVEEHPDIGVVGPRILHGESRPPRIWFDGGVVDAARWGATWHRHAGRPEATVPPTGPVDVDYVTGASMLVRRAVLDRVGLIPEHYFLYFEETEFCLRVREAGWRTMVDPRARMHHHKRSSGAVPTPYYLYYMTRNRMHFAQRNFGGEIDAVLADLREVFLDPWRRKVEQNAPGWTATFDEIVDLAVRDARAGVLGRRREVEQFPRASAGSE